MLNLEHFWAKSMHLSFKTTFPLSEKDFGLLIKHAITQVCKSRSHRNVSILVLQCETHHGMQRAFKALNQANYHPRLQKNIHKKVSIDNLEKY